MVANRKKIVNILVIVALLAIVVVVGGVSLLENKLSTEIEERIADLTGAETELASLELNLFSGRAALYGLTIRQPSEFGAGRMLYASRIELDFNLYSLPGRTFRFDEILIEDLELDIRRDGEGQSNLAHVSAGIKSRRKNDDADGEPERRKRTFVVDSLTVGNCRIFFHAAPPSKLTNPLGVLAFQADGRDLRFGPLSNAPNLSPGHCEIKGEILQPPMIPGRIGLLADLEGLGSSAPAVTCSLRVVGLELFLLAPVLPKGTGTVIGGNAIDLSVDAAGDKDELEGRIRVSTIAGYEHNASLAGTIHKPKIDTDDKAIAWLAARSSGAIGNTLRHISSAGLQAVESAGGVVSGIAEGAADTVGSFGSGLWRTTKGLVTLSPSKMGKGVKEMGASVTGDAKDAIFTAGGDVMEGVADIAGSATGGEMASQWRRNIPKRWTNSWEEAKGYINQ